MTKSGTKLSDEHKANIGKATKRMWESGIFDSEETRNIWRKTALAGIAKKGKEGPNKFVPSQEMMDDYSKMGDLDLAEKYGVSRTLVIKTRKRYNLPRFNNQHGTYPHEFNDGKEYKWCGSGHWEMVENFGVHSSRYDGLRGHCKEHSNDSSRRSQNKRHKTPQGKAAVRHQNSRRKAGFILWEHQDEIRSMELYKNRCAYCGVKINYKTVEFDHLHPVSMGGKTVPHNMVPSCVVCNRGVGGKKAKPVLKWLCEKFGVTIGQCIYATILDKQSLIEYETKERVQDALLFSE
jgi:5-methylcytosine-specific restriction endonuclease McrA